MLVNLFPHYIWFNSISETQTEEESLHLYCTASALYSHCVAVDNARSDTQSESSKPNVFGLLLYFKCTM